jgi:tetratricopeptide (TPR) repeat protein
MARIKSRKKRPQEDPNKIDEAQIIAEKIGQNKFERIIYKFYYKISENKLKVFGTVGIVVFIIVAVIAFQAIKSSLEESALHALEKIQSKFVEIDKAEVESKKNKLRKKFITQLESFQKEHDSTDAYNTASIYLAGFYQHLDNFRKAGDYAKMYAESRDNKFLEAYYYQIAAAYYEEAGDSEQAMVIYKKIGDYLPENEQEKNDIFTVNYYHLARLEEKKGNRDEAIKLYQKALKNISSENPASNLKKIIRTRYLFLKHSKDKKGKKKGVGKEK